MLQPRSGAVRSSPIAAILLTGAEIDQTLGLLSLRESASFVLYADRSTLRRLAAIPLFDALEAVRKREIGDGGIVDVHDVEVESFALKGKVPLYLEGETVDSDLSLGLEVRAGGARLLFVPGCLEVDEALAARVERADVILFDGTLFRNDEMIALGAGTKTGRRMGHMPVGGEDGSLARFRQIGLRNGQRRIYIHINNTNPMLIDGSAEREEVEAAGWEIAHDGMRIEL